MSDNIAESLLSELRRGEYTCLVCTGEMDKSSKIWSCHHCYRAFDLPCIRDWAKRGSSTAKDRSWRCPSCNNTHFKLPKQYTCWCGKVLNPPENEFEPHSCGQTCNSPLPNCVHGCSLPCHPGPHIKKCTAMGPVMKCSCGSAERQLPCVLTPYKTGWSCSRPCNDLMPCNLHTCGRNCHAGLCGPCEKPITGRCYCGKHTASLKCHERAPLRSHTAAAQWTGCFQCDEVCDDLLDCGNHRCTEPCHAKTPNGHKCPRSPALLTHCPCGKHKLDQLASPRTSCLDPVPTCGETCGKKLDCGHTCYWPCHEGECAPCYGVVDSKCRCNYTQYSVACKLAQQGYVPACNHKCQALMSCRRHRCMEVCCEYEPMAAVRERNRLKGIRRNTIDARNTADEMTIEAVHVCTRECGKLLSCGKHYCQMTCHLGPCRPCLESSSEDLVCHCGQTVVSAPVRCGTKLPVCLNQCQRPTKCGHRPEIHNCHEDDKECPRCTERVTKHCQCSKRVEINNAMCYQTVVSCGRVCNELLPCGSHRCPKICHPPGQCQTKCTSQCGKPRACGHPCRQVCHAPKECNESIPCQERVTVHCGCKRLSRTVLCSLNTEPLECDEECELEQRNRQLLSALTDASDAPMEGDIVSRFLLLEKTYTPYVLSLYSQQKVWCESIEQILQKLVSRELGRQTYHFRPMKKLQRKFIHELAESYKLYSESQDPEPKRSVFVRLQASSRLPKIGLKEALFVSERMKEKERKKRERAIQIEELRQQSAEFNAIVVKDPFMGMTAEKLAAELPEELSVKWLMDSFVIYGDFDESQLRALKPEIKEVLTSKNLAMDCALAKTDIPRTLIYDVEQTTELPAETKLEPDLNRLLISTSFDWY
ncbi:hypothetical protein KL938_000441 [Ogataea parapolymorpha]|nr:hypothetical protein KL938_000441 [Ogataea parapolymorpha]